jgi:hypothetical protein
VPITCKSLTTFLSENKIDRVDYLKCDCEGAEYEIFFNSPPATFEKIDSIALELHPHEGITYDDMRKFLHSVGYTTQWSETPRLLHARRGNPMKSVRTTDCSECYMLDEQGNRVHASECPVGEVESRIEIYNLQNNTKENTAI